MNQTNQITHKELDFCSTYIPETLEENGQQLQKITIHMIHPYQSIMNEITKKSRMNHLIEKIVECNALTELFINCTAQTRDDTLNFALCLNDKLKEPVMQSSKRIQVREVEHHPGSALIIRFHRSTDARNIDTF